MKFGAVIGLHHVHAKRQPAKDFVDELHGCALVAGVVDLQNANPRAVVNGRELVQSSPRSRDALQELYVQQ